VMDTGFPLLAYTVNEPMRARELLDWGLTSVFTDCPDRIIAELVDGEKSSPRGAGVHT
jgi:glycerophosphoryl diester phosphodiesterase